MTAARVRFTFDAKVPLEDVAAALVLARWACESLHGEAVVALEARHHLDARNRQCTIEAASAAGRDLSRLLLGFLRREFAPGLVRVEPLPASPVPSVA